MFFQQAKKLFFERDHLSDEGAALFVDALKLNHINKLPHEIRDHVEECTVCKCAILEVYSLLDEAPHFFSGVHPFFEPRQRTTVNEKRIIYRIAATITIASSIGLIAYYSNLILKENNSGRTIHDQKSTPVEIGTKTHSSVNTQRAGRDGFDKENFVENPVLEDMITNGYRSSNLVVVSPQIGMTVHSPLRFSWTGERGGTVDVRIMNNEGKIEFSIRTKNSGTLLNQHLKPGLYYWKIESKNELLYVGKFLVR
jgi:hypothetical protein